MAKLLCSFLLLTVCFLIEGAVLTGDKNGRIVGGKYAQLGQYPYVVTIREQGKKSNHSCSGVIIDRDWVLTVAHCVNQTKKYDIKAGIVNLDEKNPEQQNRNATAVKLDPDYTPVKPNFLPKHDFALLKVADFKFDDFVKPAKLPKADSKLPATATIAGWGAVDEAGKKMQLRLKYLNLTVTADQKHCGDYYPEFNPVNHVCTNPPDTKPEGACVGDEGAPLVDKDIVYGIVSATDYPCGKRTPTIYANIVDALSFINKTIRP